MCVIVASSAAGITALATSLSIGSEQGEFQV